MVFPRSFSSPRAVHRCAVCGRPLAPRMRVCPYCGENVPVRYPFGLPRFAPIALYLISVSGAAVFLTAFPGIGGLVKARCPVVLFRPAPVSMLCMGMLSLFMPSVAAEPGVPIVSQRRRTIREALWRMAYLAGSLVSAALFAFSLDCGLLGVMALAFASMGVLVAIVPFYALPVWTYPVCPLLWAAALLAT